MFWIALAAQVSLPVPVNARLPDIRALFSVDDFPAYLLAAGISRTVYTRTTVRPDGSVQNCTAEITSGDATLDAYTCALIIKRAKFAPAKWIDGSPAYGVIRLPISWNIGFSSSSSYEDIWRATVPDLELSVNRLPDGAHKIVGVSLEIGADENGRVVTCTEYPVRAPNDHSAHFPDLVSIACGKVMKMLSVHPPLNGSGQPSRSVQTASVHFKLDH